MVVAVVVVLVVVGSSSGREKVLQFCRLWGSSWGFGSVI